VERKICKKIDKKLKFHVSENFFVIDT